MSSASSSTSIPSIFGPTSTAEQVTDGINASRLTAIVTGATGGLGQETVRVLALRGAQIVLAVRDLEAGNRVKNEIIKDNPPARLHVLELDLSSLQSVRRFVFSFKSMDLPLNILINNAGIMACPFQLSEDGIELQFATNHLGHFLLTNLLLEKLKSTAKETGIEGRIINVSFFGHKYTYSSGIRLHKLNDKASYSAYSAYAQSKLANILHANELARRLQEERANVTANSVHPGLVKTRITRYNQLTFGVLGFLGPLMWKSIPQGAATQCYVALHPNLKRVTGKYFVDCKEAKPSSFAKDVELAGSLWEVSEKLTSSKQFMRNFKDKNEGIRK